MARKSRHHVAPPVVEERPNVAGEVDGMATIGNTLIVQRKADGTLWKLHNVHQGMTMEEHGEWIQIPGPVEPDDLSDENA